MALKEGFFRPPIFEKASVDNAAAQAAQLLDKTGLVRYGDKYAKAVTAEVGDIVPLAEGREGNAISQAPATGTTALATKASTVR